MDKRRSVSFHLDEDVLPVDDLTDCIVEFFELVKSASSDCLLDVSWYASIRHGSVALDVYPESETESDDDINQCMNDILDDFVLIKGGKRPSHFTEKTLKHYNRLQEIAQRDIGEKHAIISVTVPGRDDVLKTRDVAMVPYAMDHEEEVRNQKSSLHQAFGTVYGEVKNLYGASERYAVMYDPTTHKRMKIFFDDDLVEAMRATYLNNVYVTGTINYDENGVKKSIHAVDVVMGKNRKPVQFGELFGILGDR